MIRTRSLAYETGRDAVIAHIMDTGEYMAAMLLENPPNIEIFRACAIDSAGRYPHLFGRFHNFYSPLEVKEVPFRGY